MAEVSVQGSAAPIAALLDEVRDLILAPGLARAIGTGHRRSDAGAPPEASPWRRAELRPVQLKAGPRLLVEKFTTTQSFTQTLAPGSESAQALTELLALPFQTWRVETEKGVLQLQFSKKGRPVRTWKARAEAAPSPSAPAHDRRKRRLVEVDHPVFAALGLTDTQGAVRPRRQHKWQQVEEFVRAFDSVARQLPQGRDVVIADLGCGNAYLLFGLASYLDARGIGFYLLGVDSKAQAQAHNTAIAEQFGWQHRMEFLCQPISQQELPRTPDVVVALHACDTATDDALAAAVSWGTPLILAAPCCHHDLSRQLKLAKSEGTIGQGAGTYGMMTRHGILRERLADTLTDAMRALVLGGLGYRVEVIEFVAGEHTPRNTLITAVWTNHPHRRDRIAELHNACEFWGVTPRLKGLVDDRLG